MDEEEWVRIQRKTFIAWFNNVLASGGPLNGRITNLKTDFKDGLKLVQLLEILTGKRFEGINKRPTYKQQKLENLTIVFEYLKNKVKIKEINMIGKLTLNKLDDDIIQEFNIIITMS